MSHITKRLRVTLQSPVLVDGHTSPTSYVDATSAKRGDNHFVPASALRGALREACGRLENAQRVAAHEDVEPDSIGPLTLELFGRPGVDRPELSDGTATDIAVHSGEGAGELGGLRVSDAIARQTTRSEIRFGVGVDRWTGSAVPEVHFQREVAGAPGDVLMASIECRASAPAVALLERALELVTGLGNSQSRGLGRVRVELVEDVDRRSTIALGSGAVQMVELTAEEPLLLGGLPTPTNARESLSYVTGGALRGALVDAALRSGLSVEDPDVHFSLIDPETCVLFSDALPATGAPGLPLPAPRSLLACKHADESGHEGKKGVRRDTLVTGWLARELLRVGGTAAPHRCPVCDRVLTSSSGWFPAMDHARRVVTRLGRDLATGSAAPGLLYSTEQVEPGASFRATAARVGLEAKRVLAQISAPVRVGGLRNRGLGTVRVALSDADELRPGHLKFRRESFAKKATPLVKLAKSAGVAGLDAIRLLAVVARTDLALAPEQAPTVLAGLLSATVLAVAQSADVRSGWNALTPGPRPLRPVVAAGSAWLFSNSELSDEELARLEVEGVGDDRELGLGRLAIAPHVLLEGWT